jgi:hypothetical protein
LNDSLQNMTITALPSSPSIDYGILQGAATLMAGLLIFLTLERGRFRFTTAKQQSGAKPPTVSLNKKGIILFITLVAPCFTIAFALFGQTIFAAKVSFILSSGALALFILTG